MNTKVLVTFSLMVTVALGPASAGDGWVALTTADPACPDDSGNRYVDCDNGTVTDNLTGLVWLRSANCFGATAWLDTMTTVSGLSDNHCGLTDGSSPGDWRLPSRWEWEAMVAPAAMGCAPAITNDAGTGCWGDGPSSFHAVQNSAYWSATSNAFVWEAWAMWLQLGHGDTIAKTVEFSVWPVRGGQ